MRLLVFIVLFFSISFQNLYAHTLSYTSRIDNYILTHKYDQKKLEETKIVIKRLQEQLNHIDINSAKELSHTLNYFSDSIGQRLHKLKEELLHIQTPEHVRALYFSAYNTSRENKIEQIIDIAKNTEVNALVIDIKEIDGKTSFAFDSKNFGDIVPETNGILTNISEIIKKLHENNIYVIGRIVVFKDSHLANTRPDLAIKWSNDHSKVWTDYKGNAYTDEYSKEVWDYHINMASEAYSLGFDEINFDYVRFPTDGYISQTYYPHASKLLDSDPTWGKMRVMEEFSYYITSQLKKKHPDIKISADVFGLVTNTNLFQIGQNLESFLLHFDYIAPMIYPSHYGKGYLGFNVPDNAPYEIFKDSMMSATKKIDALNTDILLAQSGSTDLIIEGQYKASGEVMDYKQISYDKIRPWLQAFHCSWCDGATYYDREKFRKQIEAIEEFGISSWYSWNASGRYEKDWY